MKKLFNWGHSTYILLPGLIIISTNLWVPPNISHYLIGGIIEACGVFTLLILNQRKEILSQKPVRELQILAIIYFVLFIVSLFGYIFIYDIQVIHNSKYDLSILFPFWNNDDLQYMINKAGSKNNAILSYGPEAIQTAINDTPLFSSLTSIIFVLNYLIIFEFLSLGFGIISFRNKVN